jgi:hypothetical protein
MVPNWNHPNARLNLRNFNDLKIVLAEIVAFGDSMKRFGEESCVQWRIYRDESQCFLLVQYSCLEEELDFTVQDLSIPGLICILTNKSVASAMHTTKKNSL